MDILLLQSVVGSRESRPGRGTSAEILDGPFSAKAKSYAARYVGSMVLGPIFAKVF